MGIDDTISRLGAAIIGLGLLAATAGIIVATAAASGALYDPTIGPFIIVFLAIMTAACFIIIIREKNM